PTELERSGDFSQTVLRGGSLDGRPVVLYDPVSHAPFPNARIPASRLDAAAVALLAYVPLPDLPGTLQHWTMQRGLPSSSDSYTGRFSTRVSSKDNVSVSYSLRTGDTLSSQAFPGLDTTRVTRSQNLAFTGIHRFQPRFMTNYRISFNRVRALSSNPFSF